MRGILFQVIESELNRYFHRNAANMKTRTMPDNVYEFKPKVLIPLDQICESVIYGLPSVVKPTACWKLEWEDLERNQNLFASVCSYLQKEVHF